MSAFKRAERKRSKLRLAICGPSGSGKTLSALLIAKGLGGKIAMIDTERGSGELYSDRLNYDVAQLNPPFTPQRYVELLKDAEQHYDTIIIDSGTHCWAGEGGILDIHDKAAASEKNSFTAWRKVTPQHNQFVDAILNSPAHVIMTMRTKTAYEIVEESGKKKPVKIGMAPVQRDGLEYEFTIVLDMSLEGHVATASKDRTGLLDGNYTVPSEATGELLLSWLNGGADPKTTLIDAASSALAVANTRDNVKATGVMFWKKAVALGIQNQLTELVNNRYAELERLDSGNGDGPTVECPKSGDQAKISFCDSICGDRQGCPAFQEE